MALPLQGAEAWLVPQFLAPDAADTLLSSLLATLPLRQETVRIFGKTHPVPRLTSWHGDVGCSYRYSGLDLPPEPWTPELAEVRQLLAKLSGRDFNSVLVNLYRDGMDRMGWHSDDEPELGPNPVIASLSLGATRAIRFRARKDHASSLRVMLGHGSLLWMGHACQSAWQHAIPPMARCHEPRINLTFRTIDPGHARSRRPIDRH